MATVAGGLIVIAMTDAVALQAVSAGVIAVRESGPDDCGPALSADPEVEDLDSDLAAVDGDVVDRKGDSEIADGDRLAGWRRDHEQNPR